MANPYRIEGESKRGVGRTEKPLNKMKLFQGSRLRGRTSSV